jgi:NADPH-dependent ferric siderophore reductase
MSTFKEKATAFLMSRIGKTASVINKTAITDSLWQITLQLPEVINWRSCQHLKCEIGKQAYRDYTIASYDAATLTVELLIHAGHEGAGSSWAKQLQPEQSFFYAGPGGGFPQLTAADNLVCIGDASAIGHFVSLYKRRHPRQQFHTMILGGPLPATILDMPVNTGTSEQLTNWIQDLPLQETTFYVAGHIPLLVKTRKTIKELGWKQIKSSGFWD